MLTHRQRERRPGAAHAPAEASLMDRVLQLQRKLRAFELERELLLRRRAQRLRRVVREGESSRAS